ncbi:YchJ family metal-binding protein [Microbacterium sp. SSW1-59]|uniref:YchJ family protein n=1 Tax=Microbacterium xanthum TaxID=3079794 RepID=UPI002AD4F86B|nr:YchJ family metal-binding protein [Microbacterium sp. SSW1-59]MDZ8201993.1 YchJ family metal-binding protein [Microbacterium sp. SSW1-59]
MNVPRVEPTTAVHLMRSRFEAFRSGDVEWLLRTWHPDTRPPRLDLGDIRWRGLQIVDVVAGGPDDTRGTVEFRATYLTDDGLGILHERSRFVRADGRWFYVDGEVTAS